MSLSAPPTSTPHSPIANLQLDLFSYFQGQSRAWGVFEDRFGCLRRHFCVDIEGTLEQQDGQTLLTLTEDFRFNDGEVSQRIWHIQQLAGQQYRGQAADVVGQARGAVSGNQLAWQYHMLLPIGERRYKVHFDDRMYLLADQVLVNRARISKWGLTLGTVSIFFRPVAAG